VIAGSPKGFRPHGASRCEDERVSKQLSLRGPVVALRMDQRTDWPAETLTATSRSSRVSRAIHFSHPARANTGEDFIGP
jgi:hypothetical protein